MKLKFPNFRLGWPLSGGKIRRFEQLSSSVRAPAARSGRVQWVLARPLFRFAAFDLAKIPPAQRGAALRLHVNEWAPFQEVGLYVAWESDQALVWAWRRDAVAAAIAKQGIDPAKANVVPESLLAPQMTTDGSRLLTCLEGFEGQVWKGKALAASRWWPEIPDAARWAVFQRDAGTRAEDQLSSPPSIQPASLADEPWLRSQAIDETASSASRRERSTVQAVALCLAALTFWYGAQVIKLRAATRDIDFEQRELMQQAQPLLTARGEALEALARLRAVQEVTARYPDQVALMARVAEAMPRDGTFLKGWEFSDNRLKLQLASSGSVQTSEWIKRFESLGPFRSVQIIPGNDPSTLILGMETQGNTDQRLATAPTSPAR